MSLYPTHSIPKTTASSRIRPPIFYGIHCPGSSLRWQRHRHACRVDQALPRPPISFGTQSRLRPSPIAPPVSSGQSLALGRLPGTARTRQVPRSGMGTTKWRVARPGAVRVAVSAWPYRIRAQLRDRRRCLPRSRRCCRRSVISSPLPSCLALIGAAQAQTRSKLSR